MNFDGGETSFHFHPLTRDDFDATMTRFDAELANGMSSLTKADSVFGWEILKAPLTASSLDSKGCSCALELPSVYGARWTFSNKR